MTLNSFIDKSRFYDQHMDNIIRNISNKTDKADLAGKYNLLKKVLSGS